MIKVARVVRTIRNEILAAQRTYGWIRFVIAIAFQGRA
jgi:hypothetical protein